MTMLASFGCCAMRDRELREDQLDQPGEQLLEAVPQCQAVAMVTGDADSSLQRHAGKPHPVDSGLGCMAACSRMFALSCGGYYLLRPHQDRQRQSVVNAKAAAATTAAAVAAAAAQGDSAQALLACFDDLSLESPEHVLDEQVCRRFLLDQKGNVDKAAKAVSGYQAWRKSVKPALITVADIPTEFATGKVKYHGFDQAGRPIVWYFVRRQDKWNRDIEENVRLFIFCFEAAIRAGEGNGKEQMTLLIDLSGFGSRAMDLELAKHLMELLLKFYPERVAVVLFWRAPRIFGAFWKMLRSLLDADALEKCNFVGAAELPEFVDPQYVPEDSVK